MRSRLPVGLAAVATVLAVLWSSVPPASGSSPASMAGWVSVGSEELSFGFGDDHPCGEGAIDFSGTGNVSSGSGTMTGTIKAPFTISSDPTQTLYQADIGILSGSGGGYTRTLIGPPHLYTLTGGLNVQAVIRTVSEDGCTKSPFLCTVRARLVLDSSQSEHVGTLPVPAPGDVSYIVASTELTMGVRPVVISGSCPVTIQGAVVGRPVVIAITLYW
jgi:hypothetical protein